MESPLRLIALNPVDRLARTVEALLVVASAPLSLDELADATEDHPERIETAIGLLHGRYAEGRSGIVLEQVAGGFAFRASRDAADACARLFERPVERGLSQAALETLAIVAYKQPVTRHQISSIRGVNADGVLRALVDRGLVEEAGREATPGRPVLYATTPAFLERLGLPSLAALPSLAPLLGSAPDDAEVSADPAPEASDPGDDGPPDDLVADADGT